MIFAKGKKKSPAGYHIILNASRSVVAGKAGTPDFNSVSSNTSDTLIYDNSSGDIEESSLIEWADFSGEIFIIDRGLDELGQPFGFKKLVVEKLEGDVY